MIGKQKIGIVGIVLVVGIFAFWIGTQQHNSFDFGKGIVQTSNGSGLHTPNFVSSTSYGYTDVSHNSIPTKMSLQGKVDDFNGNPIDDGNLGVKISDTNSCSTNVFYDYTFPNLVQDGFFNVLLGQNELLKLNFNQDYFMCLYVNSEQLSGPQVFRGGQGEVHSDALFDGNTTIPLDVNYLLIQNDLTINGLFDASGFKFWNSGGAENSFFMDSRLTDPTGLPGDINSSTCYMRDLPDGNFLFCRVSGINKYRQLGTYQSAFSPNFVLQTGDVNGKVNFYSEIDFKDDVNVDGSLNMGCGKIFWDDANQTLTIKVDC